MENACIAHRGWSGKAPENTLVAIKLAMDNQQIDMIEIDVQMTKDGVPILIHDYTVDRTTNGFGAVKNFTLEEIKKLDAGSWFGPEFQGETIPTFEEVLKLTKGNIGLNIEIKRAGDWYQGIEDKIVTLIREYRMEKQVSIISFNHQTIKTVSKIAPELKTGLLIYGVPILVEDTLKETGATVLSMSYEYLTSSFVQPLIEKGIEFTAWTVNDVEGIKQVAAIDERIGIVTNHPDRLFELFPLLK